MVRTLELAAKERDQLLRPDNVYFASFSDFCLIQIKGDICSKCSEDAQCSADGECTCGSGLTGTGQNCPESSSFLIMEAPEDSSDVCSDSNWIKASYVAIEEVDTIIAVNVLGAEPSELMPCLKLLSESGASIFHYESLWNGFKRQEVVQLNIRKIVEQFSELVSGIYFASTPSELEPIFGNKEYFNDILYSTRNTSLVIGADLWQTKWSVDYLTGEKTNESGQLLPKIMYATLFKSKFEDWFTGCNEFGEGPFCRQRHVDYHLPRRLSDALAKGSIASRSLLAQFYDVDTEDYEKVVRLANKSNIGRFFITTKKQSEQKPAEIVNWKQLIRSLQGNWISCGCWDVNECSLEIDDCEMNEICTNTLGEYKCFDPSAPPISAARTFVPRVCSTTCDRKRSPKMFSF